MVAMYLQKALALPVVEAKWVIISKVTLKLTAFINYVSFMLQITVTFETVMLNS